MNECEQSDGYLYTDLKEVRDKINTLQFMRYFTQISS